MCMATAAACRLLRNCTHLHCMPPICLPMRADSDRASKNVTVPSPRVVLCGAFCLSLLYTPAACPSEPATAFAFDTLASLHAIGTSVEQAANLPGQLHAQLGHADAVSIGQQLRCISPVGTVGWQRTVHLPLPALRRAAFDCALPTCIGSAGSGRDFSRVPLVRAVAGVPPCARYRAQPTGWCRRLRQG